MSGTQGASKKWGAFRSLADVQLVVKNPTQLTPSRWSSLHQETRAASL